MVLSLVTLRQSGRKIFIRQHCLVQKSAVDLDLSNCDLKIHSELLLSRGNHVAKHVWQLSSKGLKRY